MGEGEGGYFQTHLLQDMKTDKTGASDGEFVSLSLFSMSIEIPPTFTASLNKFCFLPFLFLCVCVFPE